jgi:predicted DNA binding CopG/RHH family protein
MRVQLKTSAPSKPAPRRGTSAKKPAALAAQPQTASSKNPAFKNVLARTIRSASMPAQSTHKTAQAADRNRRITTRFSTTEQIRLERAAAQAGLTVSAWLRQCALHAETASASAPAPVRPGKMTNAESSSQLAGPTLFSSPPPSGLGSWLTLLRQRFLSSPARFSERA